MSRGRPEIPPSYVVDLNDIIQKVHVEMVKKGITIGYYGSDIEIVIPVYESIKEDTAVNIVWLLDRGMYISNKSRFIEPLKTTRGSKGEETYYIFDKFKSNGFEHKKSYKQPLMYEVPYVDDTEEPIYIPVYWRVN